MADGEGIDPHRLGDVLQPDRPEIGDREVEPLLDLTVGVFGQAERARNRDALDPRGDIDAVAHKVAVALLDDVAEMDSDPEFDAPVRRKASVALGHAALHLDGAAHRIDHAAELNNCAVAGALDDSPVMHRDGGIYEVAAERSQPCQNPVLVGPREPRVADDVGHQDRRELPGLAHEDTSLPPRLA